MLKYIIRRILYMIPTVFGVIMITFILFNVVGGSPAVVKLGKKASAKDLEDFEEQRGLNKPPIMGRWYRTRAYNISDFDRNAGPWVKVKGVTYISPENNKSGHISLREGVYDIPLEFNLNPVNTYRWIIKYSVNSSSLAYFSFKDNDGSLKKIDFSTAEKTGKLKIPFVPFSDPSSIAIKINILKGRLDISSIMLQKKTLHYFDSQLLFYLKHLAKFDFGVSSETNQKVTRMIIDGILPSLALTVPMFIISLILSISISLICAFFRNSLIDRFFVVLSVVLMSVNYLVWIIFGQYVLAYIKCWFPIWGFESWKYLVLPCLIGVVSGLGGNLRFYRTVMLDEMYRDYVRTAFAKGVSRRGVLFKHVLKNAMIPILTSVVMAIPFLYTGSLLLETFFGIPGLGRMGINGIYSSDFDVIRALVLVGAILYVIANLVTDICYAMVDPRVTLE